MGEADERKAGGRKTGGRNSVAPLLGALLISACQTATAQVSDPADLILTNGVVYTVEDSQPWAEAVAIRDGHILAVGDAQEIAALAGPGTKVADLGGRMLMPAFGDAHNHPVFGGMAYSTCSLHSGNSVAEYQQIIGKCVADDPGDGVIHGVGWEDGLFPPKGIPDRTVLDEVSRERPLIFKSVGGHSYWMNSKAFELAGIDGNTPNPPQGLIDRDEATGEPIGTLQEAAMALADPLIPPPSDEERRDAILYTNKLFNSLGITSWHDAGIDYAPGGTSEVLDGYAAAQATGEFSTRVSIAIKWENGRTLDQIEDIERVRERAESLGFQANAIKFYLDGVIPQHTAAMIEPYSNEPHDRGETQISANILRSAIASVNRLGYQSHVHAIGDAATREALDVFEAVRDETGYVDRRPMISHLNIIDPDDQPRFGELGVTAVFQPLWSVWEPYMELTAEAVGPERMQSIYPTRSITQGGGRVAYGADWPVASADPLLGIEVAITRLPPDGSGDRPLLAGEAVSLEQAIRSYTLDAAWVNMMDDKIGSITPGKFADLIILDRNLFAIPPAEINEAKVSATIFAGEVVYGTLP